MKKLLFLFVSIFALTLFASAQDFYIKPIFGVSAKALPNNYTTVEEKIIIAVDTIRYDDKYKSNRFSFGEGKHMGLSFGKYFNSGAEALELNASYFHGTTQKMTSKLLFEFDPYSAYSYSETWTELHTLKSLNLSLLYSRQFYFGKISPFAKVGLVGSYLMPTVDYELFVFNTMSGYAPGRNAYFYTYKYNNAFTGGGYASAGIELFPESLFSFTVEAFLQVMTYSPQRLTCVKYIANEEDAFDTLEPNELEVLFVEQYKSTENENTNRPSQLTKRNHSVGGKGLMFGLKYRL
jgi:hypothetical protein